MAVSTRKRKRKNPAAVRLAARRSAKLPAARRKEIARDAALKRWNGTRRGGDDVSTPIEEVAAELAREVPAEEWNRLPSDLIDHLDHYLYGWPRR